MKMEMNILCPTVTQQAQGGDDGEFHLEEGEQRKGDSSGRQADLRGLGGGIGDIGHPYPVHHEKVKRVADHMAYIVAEGQREAEHHPYHAHETHHDEALEHGGDHIFWAHHAAVEERQPRSHHQHKNCGRDHPGYVSPKMVAGQVEVSGGGTGAEPEGARHQKREQHQEPPGTEFAF